MQINRTLLESSEIEKHFMTDRERQLKGALCRLLISNNHRKYAERLWKLDVNIVDSKKHPDFTAAISFDEATVYISDGFLGGGQGMFNQLDVLIRHELAHNLMMHQIRLMHVFRKIHANDPDEAYERIKYSSSLHEILNIIEDFEISNKRYSSADKKVVRNMMLNGRVIGGLITEENRGWENLSLEQMYDELSNELIQINSAIRSNPNWQPKIKRIRDDSRVELDPIDFKTGEAVKRYTDAIRPSSIRAPIDVFMQSKIYNKWPDTFKNLVKDLYNAFKDLATDADKQQLLDITRDISTTSPQETFDVIHPSTGDKVCTLYTPEDKMITMDILKNLAGNINYNPQKFIVKRKNNSQEYKDGWNKTIKGLDSSKFDDDTLAQVQAALGAM